MTNTELDEQTEKFLFNVNIFDEDYVEEVVEEEPPPPTFSEEELSEAKLEAFNQGKETGTKQETDSREQHVADSIEVISKTVSTLIDQENDRETLFDTEVVATFQAVFKKLYPHFEAQHGFNEMLSELESILKKHHNKKQITIVVNPEVQSGVDAMLKEKIVPHLDAEFVVKAEETLSQNQCKIEWTDGGAIIDRVKLAGEIEASIKQVLAGREVNVHDETAQTDDEKAKPIEEDPIAADENKTETLEITEQPVAEESDKIEDVKEPDND